MLKFLLTILLISSGLKIVTANGLSMFHSISDNLCLEDQEDKKDTSEKKQTKQVSEDNFTVYYPAQHGALYTGAARRVPIRHHSPHNSFIEQPNTPPPNGFTALPYSPSSAEAV